MRRSGLHHAAGVHEDDAVGDGKRLFLVVGDVHRRDADASLQATDLDAQPLAHLGVEVGQRLVEQQHARLDDERARQRDALLLAAGERRGLAAGDGLDVADLDQRQRLPHAQGDLRPGDTLQTQAVRDVVEDGHVRPQRVALKDHGRAASLRRHRRHVVVAEADAPGIERQKAGDRAKQRGLAAARGTEDGGEATGRKLERHAAQRGHRGISLDRAGDVDGNRRRHDSHVRARRRASRRAARTASRTASSASRARRSGTRRASGGASRHVRSPTTGTPSLSASAISESVP